MTLPLSCGGAPAMEGNAMAVQQTVGENRGSRRRWCGIGVASPLPFDRD